MRFYNHTHALEIRETQAIGDQILYGAWRQWATGDQLTLAGILKRARELDRGFEFRMVELEHPQRLRERPPLYLFP